MMQLLLARLLSWLAPAGACVGTLLATQLLVGCTAKDAALAPAPLQTFEAKAQVKTLWHTYLDANARIAHNGSFKTQRIYSRPITGSRGYNSLVMAQSEQALFVATNRGNVYAVDKKNGRTLWKRSLKAPVTAGVSLFDNQLLVGTRDGEVIALDADAKGAELWRARVSSEVVAAPQSNGAEVLVKTIDGRLFCLDASKGTQRWTYDHAQPLLTFRAQSAPIVRADQAFVAFDNGQLLSFGTREGELCWAERVSQPRGVTELEHIVDLDVDPLLVGPFVVSAGANGRLVAANQGSGKIAWAHEASVLTSLDTDGDMVFVADANSHLKAFKVATGQEAWVSKALHRRELGSPTWVSGLLAVADGENYLHLLDANTGDMMARKPLLGAGYTAPFMTDGEQMLYVLSDNGALSAYRVFPRQ
jgi:outer membrane protein assembly factor BamB